MTFSTQIFFVNALCKSNNDTMTAADGDAVIAVKIHSTATSSPNVRNGDTSSVRAPKKST